MRNLISFGTSIPVRNTIIVDLVKRINKDSLGFNNPEALSEFIIEDRGFLITKDERFLTIRFKDTGERYFIYKNTEGKLDTATLPATRFSAADPVLSLVYDMIVIGLSPFGWQGPFKADVAATVQSSYSGNQESAETATSGSEDVHKVSEPEVVEEAEPEVAEVPEPEVAADPMEEAVNKILSNHPDVIRFTHGKKKDKPAFASPSEAMIYRVERNGVVVASKWKEWPWMAELPAGIIHAMGSSDPEPCEDVKAVEPRDVKTFVSRVLTSVMENKKLKDLARDLNLSIYTIRDWRKPDVRLPRILRDNVAEYLKTISEEEYISLSDDDMYEIAKTVFRNDIELYTPMYKELTVAAFVDKLHFATLGMRKEEIAKCFGTKRTTFASMISAKPTAKKHAANIQKWIDAHTIEEFNALSKAAMIDVASKVLVFESYAQRSDKPIESEVEVIDRADIEIVDKAEPEVPFTGEKVLPYRLHKQLCTNLRAYMNKNHVTVDKVAEALSTTVTDVNKCRTNVNCFTVNQAKLLKKFGISIPPLVEEMF